MLEDFIEKIPNVDAEAQYGLGCRYYSGDGVKQDYEEAVKWYTKAAEQGHAKAQYQLGLCYYNGYGVKQDYKEAANWFKEAANQGYVNAQYHLGFCFYYGYGVEKKCSKSFYLFKKAAEQGHPKAQYCLGLRDYNGSKYAEAVKWFKLAAEQGYDEAQFRLGVCYLKGYGVMKNPINAFMWFCKADEQFHDGAQSILNNNHNYRSLIEAVREYMNVTRQHIKDNQYYDRLNEIYGIQLKNDSEKIKQVLKENDVQYFYHFTDINNFISIVKCGGLYSRHYLEKNGITFRPGGDSLSLKLDCDNNIEDYVHLSFCDDHPMKHRLEEVGRKIFLLRIKIDVALWKDTLFSDMNATDNLHKQGGKLNDLKNVDFVATRRHYVGKMNRNFKYHQAEILVKEFIPLEYMEFIL